MVGRLIAVNQTCSGLVQVKSGYLAHFIIFISRSPVQDLKQGSGSPANLKSGHFQLLNSCEPSFHLLNSRPLAESVDLFSRRICATYPNPAP